MTLHDWIDEMFGLIVVAVWITAMSVCFVVLAGAAVIFLHG